MLNFAPLKKPLEQILSHSGATSLKTKSFLASHVDQRKENPNSPLHFSVNTRTPEPK